MSEERSLTSEEEQMRRQGLRILACMIARRHLACSDVDTGGSQGDSETAPAAGQTSGGKPGRKKGPV